MNAGAIQFPNGCPKSVRSAIARATSHNAKLVIGTPAFISQKTSVARGSGCGLAMCFRSDSPKYKQVATKMTAALAQNQTDAPSTQQTAIAPTRTADWNSHISQT